MLHLVAPLLAALAPQVALPQDPPNQDAAAARVTRQDLAVLVQEVDALLAAPLIQGALAGDALRAANQRFDRISLAFFGGNLAKVQADLVAWLDELAPGREPAAPAAAPVAAPEPKLSAVRAALEARLAAAEAERSAARQDPPSGGASDGADSDRAPALDGPSLRVLRARLALLVDVPSPARSREFVLSTPALAAATQRETERLLAGERPYHEAQGDLWRTVAHGERDLALRVFRPATAHDGPLPLLIAFHGAGGDENFLFELAGDGYLKQLADERGMLVVCPVTGDFTLGTGAFDALLAGLALDYTLDRERVYLLGHSMGAATVSNLLRRRGDQVRRAVCIAGFNGVPVDCPPTLVLAGELDPLAPPARLERAVSAAQEKASAVTLEVFADQGHTLLLPKAFQRAFAFFEED